MQICTEHPTVRHCTLLLPIIQGMKPLEVEYSAKATQLNTVQPHISSPICPTTKTNSMPYFLNVLLNFYYFIFFSGHAPNGMWDLVPK